MRSALAHRVAARYVEAFAFDTEKELQRYLKEHPGADPARHTVKKGPPKKAPPGKEPEAPPKPKQEKPVAPKKGPPPLPQQKPQQKPQQGKKPEQVKPEHGKPEEHEGEAQPELHPAGRKFVDTLKGLSTGAANLLQKAPKAVQKFFGDEAHRRNVLMGLHSAVAKAPKQFASNLVETAKHEVHEFKAAADGVKAALSGKKMTRHHRQAIKAVTIHMGVTATAAALSATGIGAGLAFMAKSIARHVALKSVHRVFGHLDSAAEYHHIGHGLLELLDKVASDKQGPVPAGKDPEKVLAAIVMKAVQEELANLSEEDLRTMLEQAAKGQGQGQVKKAALAEGQLLADLCDQAETVHKAMRSMIREFPAVLKEAGYADEGQTLVWQDAFIPYWKKIEASLQSLLSIDDEIEGIYLSIPVNKMALETLANVARDATADRLIPQKARIEFAFGNPHFQDGRIAYRADRLATWAEAFEGWVEKSVEMLHQTARKARRSV